MERPHDGHSLGGLCYYVLAVQWDTIEPSAIGSAAKGQ